MLSIFFGEIAEQYGDRVRGTAVGIWEGEHDASLFLFPLDQSGGAQLVERARRRDAAHAVFAAQRSFRRQNVARRIAARLYFAVQVVVDLFV